MFFVLAFLFIAEWFGVIVLVVLFGALGYAEMARTDRSPRKRALPSPDAPRPDEARWYPAIEKRRPPSPDLSSPRMTRWHVIAAALMIGSVLMPSFQLACRLTTSETCLTELGGPLELLGFAFTEVFLWSITLPALYGPMYAVRLHRNRFRAPELIGLGLCLSPVTLLVITSFELGIDPESTLAVGIAGVILFPLGLALPGRMVKALVLTTACIAMLIALSDFVGPANPVWLLAAIAMGYMVFRAEWKHLVEASRASDQLPSPVVTAPDAGEESKQAELSNAARTVTFIVVNIACAVVLWLVWRIGFGADESAPAAVFALAGLAIATCGALLTTLVPTAFGRARLDVDHAAATFVVVLVAAVVMHLIATPPVMIDSYFGMSTGWKPVLGTFACIGALSIALTTLTGRERQIRPFMTGIILPAAFLLPSDSFFTFLLREDTLLVWSQRLLEAAITATILAIMWYAFGPGRRRALKRSAEMLDGARDSEVVVRPN